MIDTAPSYSHKAFDVQEAKRVVDWIARIAKREQYDALAGCGHSGLLIVGAAAYKAGIPAIAVRKPTDTQTHWGFRSANCVVERDDFRYAFVDDCVASGATLENVVARVAKEAPDARLVAVLTYSSAFSLSEAKRMNIAHIKRFHFESLGALNE